jgi:uncharacterized protein
MTHPLNGEMTQAAQNNNVAGLQRLRDQGAEVEFAGENNPLLQAACKGHIETIRWLLDHGAAVNRADNSGLWTPLMCAGYYGHSEAARLLLEGGASRTLKNTLGQTALDCAVAQGKPLAAQVIRNNPDEVSFYHAVSDRVMQEVYNFPRRERVTLIRNGESGPVEAMQRESFKSLDDLAGLRKAFAEHRRMGGKLEEDNVFPGFLPKAKILRKEM